MDNYLCLINYGLLRLLGIVKVLITAPLYCKRHAVGTFLQKNTYKFTFSLYIIRRVLNYFFFGAVIRTFMVGMDNLFVFNMILKHNNGLLQF